MANPQVGAPVNFDYGTESEYLSATVDNNTIYFITDKNIIIMGGQTYSGSSDTWKYIGHFDSITDEVPVSYLTYDGLDKTNYACTIGTTNILYILDISLTPLAWSKAFDNLVTSFEEEVTIIPAIHQLPAGSTYPVPTLYYIDGILVNNYPTFFVTDTFNITSSGSYTCFLSKIPQEATIIASVYDGVSSTYNWDYTYNDKNNSLQFTSLSSGDTLTIKYLQKFSLSVDNIELTSSLFYYIDQDDNPKKVCFTETPSAGANITIAYFYKPANTDRVMYQDVFVADGVQNSWELTNTPEYSDIFSNIYVVVDDVDYTYYIQPAIINPPDGALMHALFTLTDSQSTTAKLIFSDGNIIDYEHVPTAKLVKDELDKLRELINNG